MKANFDFLAKRVYEKLGSEFSLEDIRLVTRKLFDIMSESLLTEDRIEIRAFGSFSLRQRLVPLDPRDNKTKDSQKTKCNSIYFRMAKNMLEKLNNK